MRAIAKNANPSAAASLPHEAECWRAVLERDRGYDGRFVYAVRSTGIYCRPTCPSRRPKRSSVRFFTASEARAAGFRPCRRCKPQVSGGSPADQTIRRAIAFLEAHLDETVTLDRLAAEVERSPSHLQRTFKERVGLSPRAYQMARRMERFRTEARESGTVGRATYQAGFNSSRSLYEHAAEGLGMTPGRYLRSGEGLEIRYTIIGSPVGRILLAATANGVCAVMIGQEDGSLREDLLAEFSRATVLRDDGSLRPWAEAVARLAAGMDPGLAVPTDLHGSVFQMKVWQTLREIPRGETRSYTEVAEAIGLPQARRAVASACASNRAALLVPCHRVIRADGGLGGYRWGLDRKQRLLESETDERER